MSLLRWRLRARLLRSFAGSLLSGRGFASAGYADRCALVPRGSPRVRGPPRQTCGGTRRSRSRHARSLSGSPDARALADQIVAPRVPCVTACWTSPHAPLALPAMYAPHVLPAARDYDALFRSFRWQVPAHYNIGVDVCDRWAESRAGPHRHPQRARRRRASRRSATARCARPRTGSPTCSARGIGARRPGRDPAAAGAGGRRRATSPSTSSAPSRCRSQCCSASRRSPIGCRIPAHGR